MASRVVVDTNILLVSISRRSPYNWLFQALRSGEYTLLVTTPIMLEYKEIISRHMGEQVASKVVQQLEESPYVEHQHVYYHWRLIEADPDDNKFVDCALAGSADYIVTHDRHFDELLRIDFPKVALLTAAEFQSQLAGEG